MNTLAALPIGFKGYFTFESFRGEYVYDIFGEHLLSELGAPIVHVYGGKKKLLAVGVRNQILDAGRNIMGNSNDWAGNGSKCQVGTNSTAPTSSDTQLLGFIAGTATIVASSDGAQGSVPYYTWDQQTYRFAEGDAEGNLSEAGVGWSITSGPFLISRALIVDGGGAPTTATVLFDEWLDVTYQLRYYPPLEDVEGTITLDGVVYDTLTRASVVNTSADKIGLAIGILTGPGAPVTWRAYDGNIGTVLQAPSGTSDLNDNSDQFNQTYINNSYETDIKVDAGIAGWNLGAGIRSIQIVTNAGSFQTQFNAQSGGATIPKDIDHFMDLTWRLSWAGWYWAFAHNRQASSDATTPTTGNWNTNLAETLLRINWEDLGATDHQSELQVESDTLFRITEDAARENWIQFRGQAIYTEGGDYTSYSVVEESSQNGGPTVGQNCTITAVDF